MDQELFVPKMNFFFVQLSRGLMVQDLADRFNLFFKF